MGRGPSEQAWTCQAQNDSWHGVKQEHKHTISSPLYRLCSRNCLRLAGRGQHTGGAEGRTIYRPITGLYHGHDPARCSAMTPQ